MRARTALAPALLSLGLATPALADVHLVPDPNGPLAGKTIVVSPGHGTHLQGGAWTYQRAITNGLREDVHTNEIVMEHLQRLLANAGARVESVRERSYQTNEVIVDDTAAAYVETGTWSNSSATTFHGTRSRFAQGVSGAPTATATFTPTVAQAGVYPLYAWWTKSNNRATDATFLVIHAGGVTQVKVDQSATGDHWLFLGEFYFAAGTNGKVILTNTVSDPTKVVIADAIRLGGGVGPSGEPRWRESASTFLPHKGFAAGAANDDTGRPMYATWLAGNSTTAWRNDFLYLALQTNASATAGSATGLQTFSYDNGRPPAWGTAGPAVYPTSPSALTAESDRLRDLVHARVLADVKATLQPAWPNAGARLLNLGELREARNMPSTLIALGFHDAPADASLLSSAKFREIAARAIYKAIVRYWSATAPFLPLAPDGLRVENLGNGQVRVSWDAVNDPLEPSATAAGYKVYVSADGRAFDDGTAVTGTSHTLTGLLAGQGIFVRVAATNQGGESLATRVAAARVGDPARRALLVDGFDRVYVHTEGNIAGRFTYDYSVEHVLALATAAPSAAVDYAMNEAVIRNRLTLAGYPLVDWLLGREGSLDRTFDPTEQQLVTTYLAAGGTLLASGTEIGWDLEARGGGVTFLHDVLGVTYVSDDAGTRALRGKAATPFAALGPTLLSDGTTSYPADSCDVFSALPGYTEVLGYETTGAPAAGIGKAARSLVLGFPIEAVTDATRRAELVTTSVEFLAPALRVVATNPGGGVSPINSGSIAVGGSGVAPVRSTTAPGATAQPVARRGGGGGGGCSLSASSSGEAPASGAPAALGLGLVALVLVRRRRVD